MKRTITMWAIVDKDILSHTVSFYPQNARRKMEDAVKLIWKDIYKNGYRCRKVKISWEE